MRSLFSPLSALLICTIAGSTFGADAWAQVNYVDRAVASGIDITWSADYLLGIDFGAGVALEDFDRDGDLDAFVATKKGSALGVFRNDNGSFTDLSSGMDISPDRDLKQVLFADLDNDGYRDLILSAWAPNTTGTSFLGSSLRIYQGQAGGNFTRRSSAVIDSFMAGLATGIAAGDTDRDGDLDLYVNVWKPATPDVTSKNRFLRNDGNFQFVDRGSALGIDNMKKSFQVSLADLTNDGWLDIVIAEDKRGGITYYQNDGDGTFTDRTTASGMDGYLFFAGQKIDGMGIALGDYDHDLDLDVYVTNINDGNVFYRNNGNGSFSEIAALNGTQSLRIGWGCSFLDCNNDMELDLYVVDFGMKGLATATDRLFSNDGSGQFTDIAPASGISFSEDGFGGAAGDIDGDGTVDMILSHGGAPVRLLMNEGAVGNWLSLDLVGTLSNRDAVGARVTVHAGNAVQHFEQHAGESYLSNHSHQIEVGLGNHGSADSVVVWWPSDATVGHRETWRNLSSGTRHVLVEGRSSVPAVAAPSMVAAWDEGRIRLSWSVADPELFESFELIDRGRRVARVEPVAGLFNYEVLDAQGVGDSEYELVSVLAGSGEVLSSRLRAPTPSAIGVLRIDPPRPNPFNPRVTLRFHLPSGGATSLRVLDARGREVTRFPAPTRPGWHDLIWNGVDSQGRAVASGTYHFELRTASGTRSVAMSLVR